MPGVTTGQQNMDLVQLKEQNIKGLIQMAKEYGVEGFSTMRKQELI
jgi:hypothetical protein